MFQARHIGLFLGGSQLISKKTLIFASWLPTRLRLHRPSLSLLLLYRSWVSVALTQLPLSLRKLCKMQANYDMFTKNSFTDRC